MALNLYINHAPESDSVRWVQASLAAEHHIIVILFKMMFYVIEMAVALGGHAACTALHRL